LRNLQKHIKSYLRPNNIRKKTTFLAYKISKNPFPGQNYYKVYMHPQDNQQKVHVKFDFLSIDYNKTCVRETNIKLKFSPRCCKMQVPKDYS
jgi:hypothetical protein